MSDIIIDEAEPFGIDCLTYHLKFKSVLFTTEQCLRCEVALDSECPKYLSWSYTKESKKDYMCIFINCIRKNLDDRGDGQSFYRKV